MKDIAVVNIMVYVCYVVVACASTGCCVVGLKLYFAWVGNGRSSGIFLTRRKAVEEVAEVEN